MPDSAYGVHTSDIHVVFPTRLPAPWDQEEHHILHVRAHSAEHMAMSVKKGPKVFLELLFLEYHQGKKQDLPASREHLRSTAQ